MTDDLDRRVSRYAIALVATVIGGTIGYYWAGLIVASTWGGFTPSLFWTVTIYLTCPSVRLFHFAWWLVPVSNALVYGLIAFGLVAWKQRRRKGATVMPPIPSSVRIQRE
jgi:hypothetical protein